MGIQINGQTDTISATDGALNIGGTVTVNVTGDATGLTGTPDITVGVVTASSAVISGDLTVNGTTTTLDTTLTEVDKLEVGANNTTVGVAITQSGSGDILRLYDGATQAVTVADGGNVGIGTDDNIFRLDVNGATSSNPDWGYNIVQIRDNQTNRNGLRIATNTSTDGICQLISATNATPSQFGFWTYNGSSWGERVRISSSGNVGIGLTNPNTRLEISANNNSLSENNTLRFTDTDTSTEGNQQIGKIEFYSSDVTTPGAGVKAYIGAFAQDTSPDAYIDFATQDGSGNSNPVTRMRIRSDGRVLIGTTNTPAYTRMLLQGNSTDSTGDAILRLCKGNNTPGTDEPLGTVVFSDSDQVTAAKIEGERDGGTWTSGSSLPTKLVFSTTPDGASSPTERMRIDSSGNVRIANASSSAPLTVRGGSASASTIHMEGGVNGVDNARISCNQNLVLACNNAGTNAGRVIQFNNNTTTLATIDASANVSIENNGAILFKGSGSRAYFNDASASSVGTSSIGGSTATLFIGNAAIQVSSDVRLKENVEDTQIDALDAISRINVKDFTWNDPSDTSHNNRNARGKWTGLIAQELVEVLPFVVNAPRKEEDGSIDHDSESIWTLDQSQLCPVLIKAIQQQQEVIASQSATIAALDARLTALEG